MSLHPLHWNIGSWLERLSTLLLYYQDCSSSWFCTLQASDASINGCPCLLWVDVTGWGRLNTHPHAAHSQVKKPTLESQGYEREHRNHSATSQVQVRKPGLNIWRQCYEVPSGKWTWELGHSHVQHPPSISGVRMALPGATAVNKTDENPGNSERPSPTCFAGRGLGRSHFPLKSESWSPICFASALPTMMSG